MYSYPDVLLLSQPSQPFRLDADGHISRKWRDSWRGMSALKSFVLYTGVQFRQVILLGTIPLDRNHKIGSGVYVSIVEM